MTNFQNTVDFLGDATYLDVVSILIPAIFAFVIGMLSAPVIIGFLYKHKLWRQKSITAAVDGRPAPITRKLNNDDQRKVPRLGGTVAVVAALASAVVFWILSTISQVDFLDEINFVNRSETWLPLFTLVVGFVVGAFDDLIVVGKLKVVEKCLGKHLGGGIPLQLRLIVVAFIGAVCGYWFFSKLGITDVYIPFWQSLDIGILIIPFIVIVMAAVYSGGIIDGIDGLAGGVFTIIFGTYAVIAALQGQFELSAFCLVVVSGLLAFLWFGVPPARFYLSDTGTMALTLTLSVVSFTTDTVMLLPIIAFPLLISSASVIIQVLSKKFRGGKKVFIVSPLHNHFRAKGWPGHKVTMRYWIIAQVMAMSGLVIFILGY